jgi:hypothetical protein
VQAAQWESARHGQTRYDAKWEPAANATALRVIVYDVNSGKHGSLDVPLSKVPKSRRNSAANENSRPQLHMAVEIDLVIPLGGRFE